MLHETEDLTSIPIKQRPHSSPLRLWLWAVTFVLGMLLTHLLQLVVWPLQLFERTAHYKDKVAAFTKRQYALLCISMSQLFAPTNLVITSEHGSLLLQNGKLQLPSKCVIVSNHQIYLDWLYIWGTSLVFPLSLALADTLSADLLYFANMAQSITIILKASLKWVPMVGPGMQFFRFIFLNRSWEADRVTLHKTLSEAGAKAQVDSDPLALMIFPEGTLVSKDTRPKSAKFAEKQGIADVQHCLLPRSTGLLFCLRALASKIPDLQLVDLTMAYPGIPVGGYGQDYYTLQSVFGAGQSPRQVHVHYRSVPVSSIPIGTLSGDTTEPTEEEKQVFSEWLINRWREKDALLDHFYKTKSFSGGPTVSDAATAATIPLELQSGEVAYLVGGLFPGLCVGLEICRSFVMRLWRGNY